MLAGATLRPQLSEKFDHTIHSAANERTERERVKHCHSMQTLITPNFKVVRAKLWNNVYKL
jgi:hypothetical protein